MDVDVDGLRKTVETFIRETRLGRDTEYKKRRVAYN
jgi:hypothetical protein